MSNPDSQTLFDRIGGEQGVGDLIVVFYQRVLFDPLLAPFFEGVSIEKMQRMQREFFAAALGGPIQYSGRPLEHVHAGMGIRPEHLQHFLAILLETLKEHDLDEQDVYDIVSRLNVYADEITGQTAIDG